MRYSILDIPIDDVSLSETVAQIIDWAQRDDQHQVVTLNAEFAVATRSNSAFKQVVQKASLITCDGAGPSLASWLLYRHRLKRVVGVEITQNLLQSSDDNLKIFLLGGDVGVVEKVRHHYPEARIVGESAGGKLDVNTWHLADNQQILEMINASGANVLLVGFGQVKQEMWINENLRHLPSVKVAVGVGGTFDYLSGTIVRAPHMMRRLGLEWLFRLIRQPQRLPRIVNAVLVFPWLVIKEKFSKKKAA